MMAPVEPGPLTSDGRQFMFIHVPKTGGLSVGRDLVAAVPIGWRPTMHAPAFSVIEGREDWFSFAFVRNPWDRMVSLWRFSCLSRRWRSAVQGDTFVGYVRSNGDPAPVGDHFKRTQSWFINDASGKRLVSFVGRFESLLRDFILVCSEIGIETPALCHINRTEHTHYRDYYDAETREMVARKYAEDIDTFGYRF